MVMSQANRIALTGEMMKSFLKEKEDVDRLDKWYRGENERPNMPAQSTREYRELQERSSTPWLGLVVTSVAQNLFVEGYRASDSDEDLASWQTWQANGLDARQIAVHRGALAHGLSYVTVLPGEPAPVIRGSSALRMMAFYQDDADDDFPMYAIKVKGAPGNRWYVDLYDDEAVYHMTTEHDGSKPEYIDLEEHGVGVCPVIRFANTLDLDGRATGEVGPFIPLAARIDQDTFDRLVVQRFGAWVVRTIAGMEKPDTTNDDGTDDLRAEKIRLRMEDILVSESPDTRFGTLPGTPLDGYIKARDSDIRDLAAVSQTPPDQLLGAMVNLSAEALAAAKSSLMAKVDERKHLFGESWEQTLRLAAFIAGDSDGASNFDAEVRWKDTETRSLAQTADALGKLAQMLGVPVQALWERVPGVSKQEVEHWRNLYEEGDPFAALADQLGGALEPVPVE